MKSHLSPRDGCREMDGRHLAVGAAANRLIKELVETDADQQRFQRDSVCPQQQTSGMLRQVGL